MADATAGGILIGLLAGGILGWLLKVGFMKDSEKPYCKIHGEQPGPGVRVHCAVCGAPLYRKKNIVREERIG